MQWAILFSLVCAAAAPSQHMSARGEAVPKGVDLARLSSWDIVVDPEATGSEAFAATEFQYFFQRASGIRLPVRRVARLARPEGHIFIGPGKAFSRSTVAFSADSFGPEDFRTVVQHGCIAIVGGRPRGTLYGVWGFLEKYLGVRFLTADHTHVPPVGPWRVVGPLDRFYHPPLRFRWSYYGEVNRNQLFAARLRINTVVRDPKLGGSTGMSNINHSFYRQIPSQKYGKEHPEYFALVGGKRLAPVRNDGYETQPCLTNPQVLKIVTQAVLKEIEAHPRRTNVSVS